MRVDKIKSKQKHISCVLSIYYNAIFFVAMSGSCDTKEMKR